jgi:hypothetical protein
MLSRMNLARWEQWTNWPLTAASVAFLAAYAGPIIWPGYGVERLEALRRLPLHLAEPALGQCRSFAESCRMNAVLCLLVQALASGYSSVIPSHDTFCA